jgi:hypothetical protein
VVGLRSDDMTRDLPGLGIASDVDDLDGNDPIVADRHLVPEAQPRRGRDAQDRPGNSERVDAVGSHARRRRRDEDAHPRGTDGRGTRSERLDVGDPRDADRGDDGEDDG